MQLAKKNYNSPHKRVNVERNPEWQQHFHAVSSYRYLLKGVLVGNGLQRGSLQTIPSSHSKEHASGPKTPTMVSSLESATAPAFLTPKQYRMKQEHPDSVSTCKAAPVHN